jgi:hypothetical protein
MSSKAIAFAAILLLSTSSSTLGQVTPELSSSDCLKIMTVVALRRSSPAVQAIPIAAQIAVLPGLGGVKQDNETVRFPGYTFKARYSRLTDGAFSVSLLPDDKCGQAWFMDESGAMYSGTQVRLLENRQATGTEPCGRR